MENGSETEHGFIYQVRANTRRYIEELVAEIESLRAQLESVQKVGADLVGEQDRFFERYASVEAQNESLANLYVAAYQLHGDVRSDEVLRMVQEIVANLIGSEELVLFEAKPGESALKPILASRVDLQRLGNIEIGEGVIGQVVASGAPYFAEASGTLKAADGPAGSEAQLTACVPLAIGGEINGALAIFRLLEQKPSLEPLDFELLDLLATQVAPALYAAKLHEQFGDQLKET
jgi:transcriptional regulator with GAF, ATPase, and Fis domain